ncbi:MAG TPA: PKD domain-containing protein [Candidatus Thermoplasmatota archaeon]|nr:PKD domain-containing protein [Candidatus Thermoplasmatota archaeon]
MKAFLAFLLVAVALAGCSGGGGSSDDEPTTTTGPAPTTSGGPATTAPATTSGPAPTTSAPPEENLPPTGSVEASLVSGAIPFDVEFSLTGTDVDGGDLSWELSFGDGTADESGADLPTEVAHTYSSAGDFLVVYRLSDGEDETEYNLTINATSAGPGFVQEFTGGWLFGDDGLVGFADSFLCAPGGGNEIFYFWFEVDPATFGLTFHAEVSDESGGQAIANWGVTFWDADDMCVTGQTFATGSLEDGETGGAVPLEGVIPPYEVAYFWSDGGVMPSVHYQA